MKLHRSYGLIFTAVLAILPAATHAETQTYRMRYDASFLGIPIGRADFTSRLEKSRFVVSGQFASAGIARLFDQTDGKVSAEGRFAKDSAVPEKYALEYKSGKKREKTAISFAGGKVAKTTISPPPKKRGKDWLPVAPKDLVGVFDPLSALMSPVAQAGDVCKRRLKVYDGEIRADLVLSPAGKKERLRSGIVTCRARFVPVSGYRKGRSSIAFLRDKARILIAFQPLGAKGHHTPVEAHISTKIGTVRIRARAAGQ